MKTVELFTERLVSAVGCPNADQLMQCFVNIHLC
jgi:hypothetical protein